MGGSRRLENQPQNLNSLRVVIKQLYIFSCFVGIDHIMSKTLILREKTLYDWFFLLLFVYI